MRIRFEQNFLTDIQRIDNKLMIDNCLVDDRLEYNPEIIYQGRVVQACIVGVEVDVCNNLKFYYDGGLAFTIEGERDTIRLNHNRTIFEFSLPVTPNAILSCPWLTDDSKFLESIGTDLGSTFYKDIEVSSDSLVWKESFGKYVLDRGQSDNHSYDIELSDTKSGRLEERPIKFKSYQNIIIEPGNWKVDVREESVLVKHDVYSEISDSSFFVWDSPMIDSKVNIDEDPECINKIGEYLDPGNVVYGNTDCFQYTNYQSNLKGFRITGTEGTKVEIRFNQESTGGSYISLECVIDESGVSEVRFPEPLPYYHFNGIVSTGPCTVSGIETIMYLEEYIDTYIPNPDKTYVARIENVDSVVKIEGTCDYIEYEKYLGEVKEIGRGTVHINSVPGIDIVLVEDGGLNSKIDPFLKQIECKRNTELYEEVHTDTFQIVINNNIEVSGNTITLSTLVSDYKVRIEQTGIIWRITNSPDYVYEDEVSTTKTGIYLLEYKEGEKRNLKIITNQELLIGSELEVIAETETNNVFTFTTSYLGRELIDGDYWETFNLEIETKSENYSDSWRPKTSGNEEPYLVKLRYGGEILNSVSFYPIQLREIEPKLEVWEETLPGKFTKVDTGVITIFNSLTKNYIVLQRTTDEELGGNWYYYDLSGINKFYITDLGAEITNVGVIYVLSTDLDVFEFESGTGELRTELTRVINVNRSDLINDIGVLTVTNTPTYPGSWRDLINNNTVNISVERLLTNIYINVNGENEDLELEVSKIGVYPIEVLSNFKYIIEVISDNYLGILENDSIITKKNVFSGYNTLTTYNLALLKLDDEGGLEDTVVEIRSGNIVRRITLKVVDLEVTHTNFSPSYKIYENGGITPSTTDNTTFIYKSTTTPNFEYENVKKVGEPETTVNFSSNQYSNHQSGISITVPNALSLKNSKYPMESFGSIKELSLSYSGKETTAPLECLLFMKGKEHYIWSIDSIESGFSKLPDPPSKSEIKRVNLNAAGDTGIDTYIVSRYGVSNGTFIIEHPLEGETKISRNELEATIKVSPQQKITLDEISQIEYAIPIHVKCNVENNGGNVFIGKYDFKAYTQLTADSKWDLIDAPDEIMGIITPQEITSDTSSDPQTITLEILQSGSGSNIFKIFSDITEDFDIFDDTRYIIPEISSDYIISDVSVSTLVSGQGKDDCEVTSEWGTGYFLVKVHSKDRIADNEPHWFAGGFGDNELKIANNTNYSITVSANHNRGTFTHTTSFIKYGCNVGFYVEGRVGFGYVKDENNPYGVYEIPVSSEGGRVRIHAGIFNATDGISSSEALRVPAEYKFIGKNAPMDYLWEGGNSNDEGNLSITIPPRLKDDTGKNEFILQVSQPHIYYPLNLYIKFYQESSISSYKLEFVKEKLYINSNGTVDGGDDKLYFTYNMNEALFEDVTFKRGDENIPDGNGARFPDYPDDLRLEEIERNVKEGYVRFRFKPNGYRKYIDTTIQAIYEGEVIGELPVEQGYFCLTATYHNPFFEEREIELPVGSGYTNFLSRKSPSRVYTYYHELQSQYYIYGYTPCKSNDDNSNSMLFTDTGVLVDGGYIAGRGVYTVQAYKKEWYDEEETSYTIGNDFGTIFNNIEILYVSQEDKLESYNMYYIANSQSGTDLDARVNSELNPTIPNGLATNYKFSTYCPYIEFNYEMKEEYIRNWYAICVASKIVLKHPNTGELVNFYAQTLTYSKGSSEPPSIDTFEVSSTSLRFGNKGGYKEVSYLPPAYYNNRVTLIPVNDGSTDWITVTYDNHSNTNNIIGFTARQNISIGKISAYYRTLQAKLEVFDPRVKIPDPPSPEPSYHEDPDDPTPIDIDDEETSQVSSVVTAEEDNDDTPTVTVTPLKVIYIDIEQEPDIVSGSGGGGGGDEPVTSDIYVSVIIHNPLESSVISTGGIKFVVEDVEKNHYDLWINLKNYSSTQNVYTWVSESMTTYKHDDQIDTINSAIGIGINPEYCVGMKIVDCKISFYDDITNPSSPTLREDVIGVSIEGEVSSVAPVFEKNVEYKITINSFTPPEPEPDTYVRINVTNNTDTSVSFTGEIILLVNVDGTTTRLSSNAKPYSDSSNIYSLESGATQNFYNDDEVGNHNIYPVSGVEDVSICFNKPITGCELIYWDSVNEKKSSTVIGNSISVSGGSLVFNPDVTYNISINSYNPDQPSDVYIALRIYNDISDVIVESTGKVELTLDLGGGIEKTVWSYLLPYSENSNVQFWGSKQTYIYGGEMGNMSYIRFDGGVPSDYLGKATITGCKLFYWDSISSSSVGNAITATIVEASTHISTPLFKREEDGGVYLVSIYQYNPPVIEPIFVSLKITNNATNQAGNTVKVPFTGKVKFKIHETPGVWVNLSHYSESSNVYELEYNEIGEYSKDTNTINSVVSVDSSVDPESYLNRTIDGIELYSYDQNRVGDKVTPDVIQTTLVTPPGEGLIFRRDEIYEIIINKYTPTSSSSSVYLNLEITNGTAVAISSTGSITLSIVDSENHRISYIQSNIIGYNPTTNSYSFGLESTVPYPYNHTIDNINPVIPFMSTSTNARDFIGGKLSSECSLGYYDEKAGAEDYFNVIRAVISPRNDPSGELIFNGDDYDSTTNIGKYDIKLLSYNPPPEENINISIRITVSPEISVGVPSTGRITLSIRSHTGKLEVDLVKAIPDEPNEFVWYSGNIYVYSGSSKISTVQGVGGLNPSSAIGEEIVGCQIYLYDNISDPSNPVETPDRIVTKITQSNPSSISQPIFRKDYEYLITITGYTPPTPPVPTEVFVDFRIINNFKKDKVTSTGQIYLYLEGDDGNDIILRMYLPDWSSSYNNYEWYYYEKQIYNYDGIEVFGVNGSIPGECIGKKIKSCKLYYFYPGIGESDEIIEASINYSSSPSSNVYLEENGKYSITINNYKPPIIYIGLDISVDSSYIPNVDILSTGRIELVVEGDRHLLVDIYGFSLDSNKFIWYSNGFTYSYSHNENYDIYTLNNVIGVDGVNPKDCIGAEITKCNILYYDDITDPSNPTTRYDVFRAIIKNGDGSSGIPVFDRYNTYKVDIIDFNPPIPSRGQIYDSSVSENFVVINNTGKKILMTGEIRLQFKHSPDQEMALFYLVTEASKPVKNSITIDASGTKNYSNIIALGLNSNIDFKIGHDEIREECLVYYYDKITDPYNPISVSEIGTKKVLPATVSSDSSMIFSSGKTLVITINEFNPPEIFAKFRISNNTEKYLTVFSTGNIILGLNFDGSNQYIQTTLLPYYPLENEYIWAPETTESYENPDVNYLLSSNNYICTEEFIGKIISGCKIYSVDELLPGDERSDIITASISPYNNIYSQPSILLGKGSDYVINITNYNPSTVEVFYIGINVLNDTNKLVMVTGEIKLVLDNNHEIWINLGEQTPDPFSNDVVWESGNTYQYSEGDYNISPVTGIGFTPDGSGSSSIVECVVYYYDELNGKYNLNVVSADISDAEDPSISNIKLIQDKTYLITITGYNP